MFMIKQILSASAVAALILGGCTTDNSTAPIAGPNAESSSSVQNYTNNTESSSSISDISSSSENSLPQPFTQNDCSVNKVSDNSVVLEMTVESEKTTMMMTLVGADVEMDLKTTYDATVPDAKIAQLCAESNESAVTLNATVVCDGRSISVKYRDSANGKTVDDVIESANELCDMMKMYKMTNSSSSVVLSSSSVLQSSSSNGTSGQQNANNATCEITVDTDTSLALTAIKPDSITVLFSVDYSNGVITLKEETTFADNIPEAIVAEACEEAKKEAREESNTSDPTEIPVMASVQCEGRTVTSIGLMETKTNILAIMSSGAVYSCDEIKQTGIYSID